MGVQLVQARSQAVRSDGSTRRPSRVTARRTDRCEPFRDTLKPGTTVLVDEIGDRAGNVYSGMPARLYVLNPTGRMAFTSRRGPSAFKAGEMEQALIIALLDTGS